MNGHTDVLPEGAEEKRLLPGAGAKRKEKANVGKKRKAPIADTSNEAEEEDAPVEAAPRPKKVKTKKALPESNDDKLDALIANRKSNLKKQKADALKALET
jgi:ribosome biogenesis protein UTP30